MLNKETDQLFLEYFFACGDVNRAAAEAGIGVSQAKKIAERNKDKIVDNALSELALSSVKAVKTYKEGMDCEAGETQSMSVRLKAADGVLDRIGAAKKQALDIQLEAQKPIYYAPVKK